MVHSWFRELTIDELRTNRLTLSTGYLLFAAGAPTDSLFFVESGCIRLVVQPVDGKELVLYRARDQELIAEDHLFRDTYAFTAIADKQTVVTQISRRAFAERVMSDRRILQGFLESLGERNDLLRQNFERLALPKATDKVLHLLSCLTQGTDAIDLTGRLKTFASDLNITHETMYRALRTLEERGKIARHNGWVRVLR